MKLEKSLTVQNMNQRVLTIEYAVQGPIVQRAEQIERELQKGVPKPFDSVVYANIADGQALGQKPITFIRQVLSAVVNPSLLQSTYFPKDVKVRAQELLNDCKQQSVGSCSHFAGLSLVRRHVAEFITRRDGAPASPSDIYITSGTASIVKSVLKLFAEDVDGKPSSVMISCPQYPLFSGALSALGIRAAYYQLDEKDQWIVNAQELERCFVEASNHSSVRAIVVINPGNPTGQILSQQNMEEIIKFAFNHNLFILADEVHQNNVVAKPFISFKKVMHEMGSPYSEMELASFFTASKGWVAESGLRSGYCELVRLHPLVRSAFHTMCGMMQCASVLGQCALDCVVKPPTVGEESYNKFAQEVSAIRHVFAERIAFASRIFNSIPGYSCNVIDCGIVAYPRIEIPERAQELAEELHMAPDDFYALRLLEETGICVVPGTGFGQAPGSYHFRATILNPDKEFQHMMDSIRHFHINFLRKYS